MRQTTAAFCSGGMQKRRVSHGLRSFFEHAPDRLVRDDLPLQRDEAVGEQAQRPAGRAGRRRAAGDAHQVRFLAPVQLARAPRARRSALDGRAEARVPICAPDADNRRRADVEGGAHLVVRPARARGGGIGFEQDTGVRERAGGRRPHGDEAPQRLAVGVGEHDVVFGRRGGLGVVEDADQFHAAHPTSTTTPCQIMCGGVLGQRDDERALRGRLAVER
jgi:hypothetical protein